tara:strand:- start:139 stop:318 length:180 start_codon:yes stop_codon:yes gene_type:complete
MVLTPRSASLSQAMRQANEWTFISLIYWASNGVVQIFQTSRRQLNGKHAALKFSVALSP